MQFRFDAHQPYQQRAVASVVDLFKRMGTELSVSRIRLPLGVVEQASERLQLDPKQLLENVRHVQAANGLPQDDALRTITEKTKLQGGPAAVTFPNVTVEMETGTGKTYVYLRTALELNRRYGLSKFVVVVPSVAVREGVLKTFQVTKGHFAELFDNVPYRFDVYDSKNLARLKSFADDDGVRFLVMTIASFRSDDNVIAQPRDQLRGGVGLHLLQSVRPVLILDEPQNMEAAKSRQALAGLNPLAALRYSATHREKYNLVYRLSPFDAYRQGLVKKIEVASVVEADSDNRPFVRVDGFGRTKTAVSARIAVRQRMAGGEIKEKAYTFKPGDSLAAKANRSEYAGYVIDQIDTAARTVSFENGLTLAEGDPHGREQEALFKAQVRYAVEQHFRRQDQLRPLGVKVLTLFFLDTVASYAPAGPDALVRNLFREAFDELKGRYPAWAGRDAEAASGAYFASKKRKGGAEFLDSTTGESAEDRAAYTLIMKDKERLLSSAEPVSFLFSHSALREGWDNPNVFQICTLNRTASGVKKRQEIGRGMRLAVTEGGDRLRDERVNVLTVVANESYEDYVRTLQEEIADEFGADEARKVVPANANAKKKATRKPLDELPEAFRELWEKIRRKTRYMVAVDTPALVAQVVDDLNLKGVEPPRITVTKARVEAKATAEAFTALQMSGAKTVATLAGRFPLPNLVEKVLELLEHSSATPVRLTRRTVLAIIEGVADKQAVLDNPIDFAKLAADAIREKLEDQLVFGIRYEPDGTWYEQGLFAEQFEAAPGRLMDATKSLYDRFAFDSEVERRFAEKLESRADVRFYLKLPGWFKVATPIGQYNPDWAIVMEEADQFGDRGGRVYMVRETKGTKVLGELRPDEQRKVRCAARHFNGALGVDYQLNVTADELPAGTRIV